MDYDKHLTRIWCEEGHLFIENKCILFQKYSSLTNLLNAYETMNQNDIFTNLSFTLNNSFFEYFSLIQHFTIHPLQFILRIPLNDTFLAYTAVQSSVYGKFNWISRVHNETISQHEGYLLLPSLLSKVKVPPTLFQCTDGSYINEILVCNGIKDCNDEIDEQNCICKNYSSNLDFQMFTLNFS